jgi:hypothetical protein
LTYSAYYSNLISAVLEVTAQKLNVMLGSKFRLPDLKHLFGKLKQG